MKIKFGLLVILPSIFFCSLVLAQNDFSNVEIQTTYVQGKIYMLEGRGGNIGISIGDDGILMVDDQFAPLSQKILSAVKSIQDAPIKFVLNTHYHYDHTGGNEEFGKTATIIAHDNVRQRLSQKQVIAFLESVRDPLPKGALPVITFAQSISVHFNDEEIRVIHLPRGHTDGDSVIFFTDSNVVHLGDLFFSGSFPFIDLENGGSVQGVLANIRQLMPEISEDARIIPGHGPLSSKGDLVKYLSMLVETMDLIQAKISQGKELKEIIQEGFPQRYQSWGDGFISTEQWIKIVYNSLQGK